MTDPRSTDMAPTYPTCLPWLGEPCVHCHRCSAEGFRVTETIEGAHAQHATYHLLAGDLLVRDRDGSWAKEAPGLAISGFILTPEQVSTLEPVRFVRAGLSYAITEVDR